MKKFLLDASIGLLKLLKEIFMSQPYPPVILTLGNTYPNFIKRVLERQEQQSSSDEKSSVKIGELSNKIFLIENAKTGRYLFPKNLNSTHQVKVLLVDANYCDGAHWKVTKTKDGNFLIVNKRTGGYLSSTKKPIKGQRSAEQGSTEDPEVLITSCAHGDKSHWKITKNKENLSLIKNAATGRYLFSTGKPIKEGERGAEKGWTKAPGALTTDDNYLEGACWNLKKV